MYLVIDVLTQPHQQLIARILDLMKTLFTLSVTIYLLCMCCLAFFYFRVLLFSHKLVSDTFIIVNLLSDKIYLCFSYFLFRDLKQQVVALSCHLQIVR